MIDDINCVVSVDPGKTGAMAIIKNSVVEFYDYQDDLTPLRQALRGLEPDIVAIEKVQAFPMQFKRKVRNQFTGQDEMIDAPQGVVSNFNFGMNYGIWQELLRGCTGKEPVFILPRVWQVQVVGETNKGDKKKPLRYLRKLYPELAKEKLKLEKHTGRADALCIGLCAAWQCTQGKIKI